MVTRDQLRAHTGRQPFEPFWVRLASGETLYITEPFRAVVSARRIVLSPNGRDLRWIPLDEVADHGVISTAPGNAGNGNGR